MINASKTIFLEDPSFFDAIIGSTDDGHIVYSYERMVNSFINDHLVSQEEAIDFVNAHLYQSSLIHASDIGMLEPIIVYEEDYDLQVEIHSRKEQEKFKLQTLERIIRVELEKTVGKQIDEYLRVVKRNNECRT